MALIIYQIENHEVTFNKKNKHRKQKCGKISNYRTMVKIFIFYLISNQTITLFCGNAIFLNIEFFT